MINRVSVADPSSSIFGIMQSIELDFSFKISKTLKYGYANVGVFGVVRRR
ncbi:hypothetical protein SNK12g_16880 [Lactiplantibacillus plantarum]|nr:hypothetical protein AWA2013_08210 [Lactiplantibacillus plantarum]BEI63314.1 hypothetical protein IYO1511_c07990 [Lactiplantibacillus plantarum]